MHLAVRLLLCGRLADTVAVYVSHSPTRSKIRLFLALSSLTTMTKLRWRHRTLVRLRELEHHHPYERVRELAELLHGRFLRRWSPNIITKTAWTALGGYWPPPSLVAASRTAGSSSTSHPQSLTSRQSATASISSAGVRRVWSSPPCAVCAIAVPGRAHSLTEWMMLVHAPGPPALGGYQYGAQAHARSPQTRLTLLQASPLYQAWQMLISSPASLFALASGASRFRDCTITCPACQGVFYHLHWEWLAVCYNASDGPPDLRMQAAMDLLLGPQARVDFSQ